MRKALFLDRDGVINHDKSDGSFTYTVEDFVLLSDVASTLKIAQEKGYLLIVITNQSGIGQGIYSHTDVANVHAKLVSELATQQVQLTEIYYCPHHPSTSNCICRKPDSNMIEKAIARFNIDPSKSIMVGDRPRDCEAAVKTGVKYTLLIETNSSLKQVLHLLA